MQPWYSNRSAVKAALDFAETARNNAAVDRALAAASRQVDRLCNRRGFWPLTTTRRFDWPAMSSPTPGRLWLGNDHLVTLTAVTSGGATIATGDVQLYPDEGPPYSRVELDRSSAAAFGLGSTAQKDVALTGVWGWSLDSDPAGALAAAVSSTTATAVTLTDGSTVDVGDLILVDTERMLVSGKGMASASLTVGGAGLTASASSNALTVSGGAVAAGEVLLVGAERLLVTDFAGGVAVVRRAWDGTTLGAHNAGDAVLAARALTVVRGFAGTTAATHSSSAAVTRHAYPDLVVQLTVAEAVAALQAESSGWARTAGAGERSQNVAAGGLEGLRLDVVEAYGRRVRHGAV